MSKDIQVSLYILGYNLKNKDIDRNFGFKTDSISYNAKKLN